MQHIAAPGATRWALAVLAALALATAAPTAVQAATGMPGIAWMPSASRHGHAIQHPGRPPALPQRVRWPSGWHGALRLFAGYGRHGGSPRVREVQRRLRRLGYRPGPVDGLFGPRTQAATGWFQYKQGLPTTGVVDARTLFVLRRQTEGGTAARKDGLARARNAAAGTRRHAREGDSSRAQRSGQPVRGKDPARKRAPGRPASAPASPARVDRAPDLIEPALLLLGLLIIAVALAGPTRLRRARPTSRRVVAWRDWGWPVHRRRDRRRPVEVRRDWLWPVDAGPDQPRPVVPSRDRPEPVEARPDAPRPARASEPTVPSPSEPAGQAARSPATVAYVTVAPEVRERGGSRAVAAAIEAVCKRRGWSLLRVVHDAQPAGQRLADRPGLSYALHQIAEGAASRLLVVRLRDLTGAVTDLGPLLQWLDETGASLVALDIGIDTATPEGRAAARALVEVSGWERRRIADRTRSGLAAARTPGAKGRRRAVRDDPELAARIEAMRAEGKSLQAIADALNDEGVPTLRGGRQWRPSSVQAAVGYRRPAARSAARDLPPVRPTRGRR
jgi:DNA invertase Pin-like site-specific DNA recombinase